MPRFSPAVSQLLPYERYYLALGMFIQRYAGIEARLQALLWRYAEVPPEVARSIFSGVRVDQAVSFIKRLHKSRGIEMHPMMIDTLDQIGVINAARNLTIHYGAEFDKGEPQFVTDQRISNRPEDARWFPISVKALDALTADIKHIHLRINLVVQREQMKPEKFEGGAERMLRRAWQYKHVPEFGTHP